MGWCLIESGLQHRSAQWPTSGPPLGIANAAGSLPPNACARPQGGNGAGDKKTCFLAVPGVLTLGTPPCPSGRRHRSMAG